MAIPKNRIPIPDSERAALPGARIVGAADPNERHRPASRGSFVAARWNMSSGASLALLVAMFALTLASAARVHGPYRLGFQ